ncbi:hypothetical protein GF382_03570 [Candidatus Falkowbacteria bacterium]|nr:hypothetical protein [Candidatus Falkowbacteria bacterium]
MKIKNLKILSVVLLLSVLLSACSLWPDDPSNQIKKVDDNIDLPEDIKEDLQKQSGIKKFSDYEELAVFLEENDSGDVYGGYGLGSARSSMAFEDFDMGANMEVGIDSGLAELPATKQATGLGGGGGAEDFSQTNVQVKGVDEADIIKNDGKYVYAVVNNNLFIVDAYPAEKADILAKIEFKSRPQDIYINDDRLVVFGYDTEIFKKTEYKSFRRRYNYVFFKVFDISNRREPKELRDLDFEGNYSNSRMIGDYVYFVTNYNNYYYIPEEPVIPRVLEDGKELSSDCQAKDKCFAPEVYYFDIPYDNYNFTSITAINIKDNSQKIQGDIYMLSANQNMYVSQDNIFITYTRYVSEYELSMAVMKEMIYPKLSEKDQERIRGIEAVDSYILSDAEKLNKIARIIERYTYNLTEQERKKFEEELEEKMKEKYKNLAKEMEKTIIHKIAIDNGQLEYKANGEVTGAVLNQFSMDENGGYFRIATTKNRTWSRYVDDQDELESYSNLYVLDEDLKQAGSIEGLAKGERIYSVRFMQDRAYLVTFKQVDPLFVVDLKNPRNPKVLGELKIPGFSNYLHPYDDDLLIGIGKDTKETEWGGVRTLGVKLSLFDVSDVSDPKEVDTYVMGDAGSDSIALHDHKAFLFSKDKNLLVLPMMIREDLENRGWGKLTFSGAAVFDIDEDGFELKGKIDHSDGGQEAARRCWGYCFYDNNVLRSLYMDDVLYTFSNNYLKMNDLGDLDEVKSLKLEKEKDQDDDDFVIIN